MRKARSKVRGRVHWGAPGTSRVTLALAVLFGAVVLAACTSQTSTTDAPEVTTSSEPPTTTAVATTTTSAPDLVDLFTETMSDPRFAVSIEVTGRIDTPVGPLILTGHAAVDGANSLFFQESDYSELDVAVFEARTVQLIGPGAVQTSVEESRIVDGWVYKHSGGRWMVHSETPTDGTAVGHIMDRIGETEAWEDAGVSEDPTLTLLKPVDEIEYDSWYFGIDDDLGAETISHTEVLVTDDGFPRSIQVDIGISFPDGDIEISRTTYEFVLTPANGSEVVEVPSDVYVSLQDLNDAYTDGEGTGLGGFVDFAVPADWVPIDKDDGALVVGSTRDPVSIFFWNGASADNITVDESLPQILADVGMIDPEIEESTLGGFPAAFATDADAHVFYTILAGNGLVAAIWNGTSGDPEADRQTFDDILSTLEWTTSGGAVPGSSISSAELQLDTVVVLEEVVAVQHEDCADVSVVNTQTVGGDHKSWVEHWTLLSCEGTDTYEITFHGSPAGGTDIRVSPDQIATVGHTHDA